MIVYGGYGPTGTWGSIAPVTTGARYDPLTDTWTLLPPSDFDPAREGASAVWAGNVMIVWGGKSYSGLQDAASVSPPPLGGDGRFYDPITDSWSPLTGDGRSDRYDHVAVWTGPPRNEMIVWGGKKIGSNIDLEDGARYSTATHSWTALPAAGAPAPRSRASAVWTGSRMIVWGGTSGSTPLDSGAEYDPATNTWTALPSASAPAARYAHTAVWSGSSMVVWGGFDGTHYLGTGAKYDECAGLFVDCGSCE